MILSNQAESLTKHIKDFDREDFEKWWRELPNATPIGTNYIFQYLDMKDRGLWKDGNFAVPKEVQNGR